VPRDFGGKQARTTWDGLPVSEEPPYGCTIVVFRHADNDLQILLLHRKHNGADYEGDWAWTSPAGARMPGESVDACARRELAEEAGLVLPVHPVACGAPDWCVHWAQAPQDATITLDVEHDRYEWLAPDDALRRSAPERVRNDLACVIALLRHDSRRR
jgi:8-oxo-dGTP pyrophosphatase MutT (NUDIX family)